MLSDGAGETDDWQNGNNGNNGRGGAFAVFLIMAVMFVLSESGQRSTNLSVKYVLLVLGGNRKLCTYQKVGFFTPSPLVRTGC